MHNSFPTTTVHPNVYGGQRDPLLDGAVAVRAAREEWPDSRLDALIERTVTGIERTVGSRRAGFSWTGAVDSLVLAHIAGFVGIHRCVLAITDLEYPGFLRWVTDCMPDGLTVVFHRGQDLRWLSTNPLMLFPRSAHSLRHWQAMQQQAHDRYFQDEGLGMLLLGGRRDGPYAYGPFKELTWRCQDSGVVLYTPLVDWPPAAMLSLIHRERIPLPPCYGWPRGLQVGPGPWPARPGTTSVEQGFEEVWRVDEDLVRGAAQHLPQASRWLELTGRS